MKILKMLHSQIFYIDSISYISHFFYEYLLNHKMILNMNIMILTKSLLYYHKMELLEHHSKVENNNYRLPMILYIITLSIRRTLLKSLSIILKSFT